jgi:hypothetical protein
MTDRHMHRIIWPVGFNVFFCSLGFSEQLIIADPCGSFAVQQYLDVWALFKERGSTGRERNAARWLYGEHPPRNHGLGDETT